MMLEINGELETAIAEAAAKAGTTTEKLALRFLNSAFSNVAEPYMPRDEWEAIMLSVISDCGVSLSDEAISRELMYD